MGQRRKGELMASFGSPAWRGRLRLIATALVVALAATLLSTVGRSHDEQAAASADERFPLAVHPDLPHVAGGDVVVSVGVESSEPKGVGSSFDIDGAEGVSGLVQVTDEAGHLAGAAIVPKDDVALFGVHDDGAFDVPVNYRTSAFSIFATQPGIATTDPSVTMLIASLATDLPEMEALARALEQAAREDPAYLEQLSPEVTTAVEDLLKAFDEQAKEVHEELSGGTAAEPQTLRTLRSPATAPLQADPDDCGSERVENVIVIDTSNQDHVCVGEAVFNGSAWEVSGTSKTPRWAVARPVNHGVPAEQVQLVPGKALALPSVEAFAFDVAEAIVQGNIGTLANAGISVCNGVAWLFGKRCGDPNNRDAWERLVDKVKSYFADTDFSFELSGSEAQTILSVNGLGSKGGEPGRNDVAQSIVATTIMTVVVPVIGIVIDTQNLNPEQLSRSAELRSAIVDTAAQLVPDVANFLENIRTGGFLDKVGTLAGLVVKVIRATVDSGLLLIILRETLADAGQQLIVEQLERLATNIGAAPIQWIDLGIDVVNAGATLLMLVDDIPELSTSSRYALGYERAPEHEGPRVVDPEAPPPQTDPVGNPGLPSESCGLRVALVLDRSSSIRDAGEDAMQQVRESAVGLIDALGTTPSSVRVTSFGTWVTTRIGWTSLADAEGRRAARQAAQHVDFASNDNNGSTNWEAALTDVLGQDADLAVLVTDGNPTVYGSGISGSGSSGNELDPVSLAAGVDAANLLKQNGTRVVAVGVGDVNVGPLRQVSGPREGSDYFVGDFASLGQSLAEVATTLCGGGLVVRHLVDGSPTAGGEYTFEVPHQDPQQLVTAADGTTRLSVQEQVDAVTVRGPAGLPLDDITCDQGGQPVEAHVDRSARAATVDLDGVVTCTFAWRGLTGPDAALAEIVHGPGRIEVVSFAPRPNQGGAVVGCLGRPRTGILLPESVASCSAGEFGVSWAAGFAVFRYDDTCASCPDASTFEVTAGNDGEVRFRLDAGGSSYGGFGLVTVDLDMTVAPPGGPAVQPRVSGSLVDSYDLQVTFRQPPQPDVCLAAHEGSSVAVVAQNVRLGLGVGC